ncbi:MAG: response regulator transcription factor [Cyanobacteria bacterium REEB67]|nr:response regulator transcription factor [Cyanobacteria bacterium REEB67]
MAKQKRILLIEDDENLRDLVSEWLVFEEYAVVSCSSGAEGVENLSMLGFDGVILDWHLGDMSGLDILRKYRAGGGQTPVMMLTGNNTGAERDQALKAGANHYISKPFKLDQLSRAVADLVSKGGGADDFNTLRS